MDADSSSISMPVAGSGSGSGPPQFSSSRGTVFDRGGYVDETMHEDDRRSYPPYPPHLPPHSPHPHRLSHSHSAHHTPPYPYSPASPASFAHSERDRDFDTATTSSSSPRRPIETTRPMSNLTYQHRQLQQQQQQQYHQASLARHQGQGQSPPISPQEAEAFGSRSTRFSLSSIDGNNHHTHPPLPPSHSHRHRESSLPLSSAKETAEIAASIGNRDLDSPPLADRPPLSSTSSSSSTSHGRISPSHAAVASTSSSSITQTTATTTGQSAPSAFATTSISTTTINNIPLDDPSPSSRPPYARRDWDYDFVPRASLRPLDNPRDFHPYVRAHHYQHFHDAQRRHSAQLPPHAYPYPYEYPYLPHRPYPLNRSGSFDEGYPEYHYPRTHWDPYGPPPPSHYPPHVPPPPPSHHSAYYDAPPRPRPPPPPHGPATSSLSRPSIDNNSSHRTGQHGEGGMSNYDSYAEDREEESEGGEQRCKGGNQSSSRFHNLRFKFGTDMPSTIDLKSAIESCDILCRFALHYGNQIKNGNSTSQETVEGSALGLDPIERANLQKIRSMNTTMLIGIQKAEKMNDPSSSSSTAGGGPSGDVFEADRMMMEEEIELDEREGSPLRFGPGQPWNVMVLELARAATSIFQLAIRIKAWVNMTPEERELDEEINMIRGKRCLLMDSTLAVPTVDQNGNLQKDWAVVPAATSTSKSFYQRQRDLEQQRQTHTAAQPKQTKNGQQAQPQSTAAKHELGTSLDSNGMMMDHDGAPETKPFKIPRRDSSNGGLSSTAAGRFDSLKGPSGPFSLVGGGGAGNSGSAMESSMSSSFTSNASSVTSSMNDGVSAYRSAEGTTRNSKNSDVPHQKYRKRAKRSQAPGRCQSCHSSDTPEWRRGPDGARTLCNACGLHYAKLLRRQNEQAQRQSPSRISSALSSSTASTTTPNSSSNINSTSAVKTAPPTTLALPAPTPVVTPTPTEPSIPTTVPAETVSASKSTSRPTGFPVISFPFKRLHGQGRVNASSPSVTSTATATTATSTATVMTTSGPSSLSLSSYSSISSSGRRTLTDHQVVPLYEEQTSGNKGGAGARAHMGGRGGSATNTSQYQLLQRQQQQYQQMEYHKPHPNQSQNQNQNQQAYMQDVSMDETPRTNSAN
ncbi:hypothetical protein BKA57DRAFT_456835 [Linnemannia elongata]|nr:hypothetical protein BKA57DRAFT_456835 [Linnemannia elongata]